MGATLENAGGGQVWFSSLSVRGAHPKHEWGRGTHECVRYKCAAIFSSQAAWKAPAEAVVQAEARATTSARIRDGRQVGTPGGARHKKSNSEERLFVYEGVFYQDLAVFFRAAGGPFGV